MSTPVIERPGTPDGRPGPQTRRAPAAPRIPAQRGPAEARRAVDVRRSRAAARESTGRAKFVLVVMVLLAAGLIATLWLSTAAAVDSYALQDARQRTAGLTERAEALRKEVSTLQSPGSLARRAAAQGLVPISDPARLVVAPDGGVTVVGEPEPAVGSPAPARGAPGAGGLRAVPPSDTSDPEARGGDAVAAAGAEPAAGEGVPDPAAPEQATAEQATAEQAVADEAAAEQAAAEQAAADPAAADQAAAERAVPDQAAEQQGSAQQPTPEQEGAEREVPVDTRAAGGQG